MNGFILALSAMAPRRLFLPTRKLNILPLVPNQEPDEITVLSSHIASLIPDTVKRRFFKHSSGPAYLAENAPGLKNLAWALSKMEPTDHLQTRRWFCAGRDHYAARVRVKSMLTGFGCPMMPSTHH